MQNKQQTVLIILDGWGYREEKQDNAIANSNIPNFKRLWNEYPHTLLNASGLAVGLPEGQMGNSEIGHTTIGAGKVIDTELVRIKKSIDTGEYKDNKSFIALFDHVKKNNSTLHVVGLLGDGGVHAHSDHLYAFIEAAKLHGISHIAIHVFTDGRDTAPQSASRYIKELENFLDKINVGFIASVSGRFYAMDRDNNWDRLDKVEKALFDCQGNVCHVKDNKPSDFINNLYNDGKLDEHLEPIVCLDKEGKGCKISDGDSVFFFNFRADRARMLSKKFIEKTDSQNICFATMTSYGVEFKCLVAFPPIEIETTIAKEISEKGLSQAHIAETEKFPHATYFLNGGVEKPYKGEEHVLLPSRKDVPTHDLAPKMQAKGIADETIKRLQSDVDFIFINFANPDMVGHTANVPAIIEAVEEVDTQLGRIVECLEKRGGVALITADHGNAELNIDPITKDKHTAHTTNLVPLIITKKGIDLKDNKSLIDIAPTVLYFLGIDKPVEMDGQNLIK
jgi:2,3-bisphosphoglycerate-independent phosphoglycerate mutase